MQVDNHVNFIFTNSLCTQKSVESIITVLQTLRNHLAFFTEGTRDLNGQVWVRKTQYAVNIYCLQNTLCSSPARLQSYDYNKLRHAPIKALAQTSLTDHCLRSSQYRPLHIFLSAQLSVLVNMIDIIYLAKVLFHLQSRNNCIKVLPYLSRTSLRLLSTTAKQGHALLSFLLKNWNNWYLMNETFGRWREIPFMCQRILH